MADLQPLVKQFMSAYTLFSLSLRDKVTEVVADITFKQSASLDTM